MRGINEGQLFMKTATLRSLYRSLRVYQARGRQVTHIALRPIDAAQIEDEINALWGTALDVNEILAQFKEFDGIRCEIMNISMPFVRTAEPDKLIVGWQDEWHH